MTHDETRANVARLLPLAVGLWLGYLLALFLIDSLLYTRPVFPLRYYLVNSSLALIVLGLVLWPRLNLRLGPAFLPLVIGLMSVVPVVTSSLVVLQLPPSSTTSAEATIVRLMPVLFIALVLTAWQYAWPYVVLYSVGISLLSMGLHVLFFQPGGPPLLPPLTVLLMQTVSFLAVGYFISTLMTRLKLQQEALARANAQLVHYAATLEELTVSRERNRLARELHDTLAHTLSALSVQLETVKAYWDVDPVTARALLGKSLESTRSGLHETRRALKSLRASPLDDLGLVLALRTLAEETAARADLKLDLDLPNEPVSLSAEVEQAIYRVAQEALANATYHANATSLVVQLSADDSVISLLVRDDGRGFNAREAEKTGHFGLAGMRERAQLVGGKLVIDSAPGQGTTLRLRIEDRGHEGHHLR
jgi:signal transduction histidine kinase